VLKSYRFHKFLQLLPFPFQRQLVVPSPYTLNQQMHIGVKPEWIMTGPCQGLMGEERGRAVPDGNPTNTQRQSVTVELTINPGAIHRAMASCSMAAQQTDRDYNDPCG